MCALVFNYGYTLVSAFGGECKALVLGAPNKLTFQTFRVQKQGIYETAPACLARADSVVCPAAGRQLSEH